MNRLAVARLGAYAAVVLVGSWGINGVRVANNDLADQNDRLEQVVVDLEAEIVARREDSCAAGDEVRQIIREVSRDGDLEVGESIIDVADADPALVAEFRDVLGRRLTANVNQLPGRRWDAASEECVDVERPTTTTEPGG